MQWVDRALATMSPYDVAQLVETYVETVPVEESLTALQSAIPEMGASELAQLGLAFELSENAGGASTESVLFGETKPPEDLTEHFRTCPPNFKERLTRFLRWNPRVIARFPERDVERMLRLAPRTRRLPVAWLAGAGALAVVAGFSTVAVRMHSAQGAAGAAATAAVTAPPASAPAVLATPVAVRVARKPSVAPRPRSMRPATSAPAQYVAPQYVAPQFTQDRAPRFVPYGAFPRVAASAAAAQTPASQRAPAAPGPSAALGRNVEVRPAGEPVHQSARNAVARCNGGPAGRSNGAAVQPGAQSGEFPFSWSDDDDFLACTMN